MKNLLMALILMLITSAAVAQNETKSITEGMVFYKQVMKLEIKLEGDAAQFAHALPKERKTKKLLYFNTEASLFKNDDVSDKEEVIENESEGMVIKMQEPNQLVFTDIVNKKQLEQKEFMTRQFLIEREIGKEKWKFTGNSKTVLGYNCQEAALEKDDKKTKVWFTPEIPVSVGPTKFAGLPGLILAVDINDGEVTIEAVKIEAGKVDKSLLQKPKKGKKVSDVEFKKIVAEKMKEMGVEEGEGGGHRIMIKIRN